MTRAEPECGPAGGRRALLVGIDDYPCFPKRSRLEGAVNDVRGMSVTLTQEFGFPAQEVAVLTDGRATREGILQALDRLLRRSRRGDVVLFHFSGHGSRRAAPGSLYRGEDLENVLVPHDSGHDGLHPNLDISGAELYTWLRHLSAKTASITLILDCCHAGALPRRGGGGGRTRTVEADERPVASLPIPWSLEDSDLPKAGESGWLPAAEAYTLIAACQGDERARELEVAEDGVLRVQGALTQALLRALREAPRGTTYEDLRPWLTAWVRSSYPQQHPQIEGARDRLIFGIEERRRRPSVLVAAREQRRLVLDAGAPHGVREGSLWGLYPPSWGPIAGEPHHRAEVVVAGASRSDAVLWPGSRSPEVKLGSVAVELPGKVIPDALPVAVVAPEPLSSWGARLTRAIERIAALRPARTAARAEVVAALLEPRPFPQAGSWGAALGPLASATCALLDANSRRLVARSQPLDHPMAMTNTLANLEGLARFRRFLALSNPHPGPLGGRVRWQLLRRDTNRESVWVPAAGDGAGEPLDFQDGARFAVELFNDHQRAVYPHLFSLGVGGGIDPLFPPPGAREALAPGGSLTFGTKAGQERWFKVPPSVPFADPGASGWVGEETLKLIVTEEPTDLTTWAQESFRQGRDGSPSAGHSLGRALASIFGNGAREVGSGVSPQTLAWSSQSVTVRLWR